MSETDRNTVYVVLGANKGIGLGLVQTLLAQPRKTVFASVRNGERAQKLLAAASSLPKGQHSALHTVEVDLSHVPDDATVRDSVVAQLKPITKHIDVFISSVGYTTTMTSALDTTVAALRDHFEVNTIGPLVVFQALWPFMKRSPTEADAYPAPKAIFLSSSVGCIGEWMEPVPGGAYGPSKAALNWLTRKLHFELEADGLISIALHPGWVQTEMGDLAAKSWDYPGKPPLTVEQSVQGILRVIGSATRDTFSGRFLSYDGTTMPW